MACSECTPVSERFCGFCGDGPYSPTGPFAARKFVEKKERVVTRESLLAEFDAMAARHRAEAKRRAGEVSVGAGTSTDTTTRKAAKRSSPTGISAPAGSSPTRRKRRTPQQMKEARAAKAEQIAESYRALVPQETRDWLEEPDELLDSILKSEER